MRSVRMTKASKVEVKPFRVEQFVLDEAKPASTNKVSKKTLRKMADALKLEYDEAQIVFAKKILTAYLKKMR